MINHRLWSDRIEFDQLNIVALFLYRLFGADNLTHFQANFFEGSSVFFRNTEPFFLFLF